ncbi:hypothetical protein HG536_0B04110 [Torulaspora globosa]|uniref:Actin-related protein 7 n=1 Tax=Torulaspora globosa TaxID=48254 RepID=A0A7G3ZDG1_9SACH|nr:uncharacterized protein HG536_0B04110 [Torulaspora globosa]QLL31547.1 hypothetical protein HG536_0B04110 [Torulaspora globosa]
MTKEDKKCVVIHNGSHSTIAGFSNMELPQCIIPSTYLQRGDEMIFGTFEMLDEAQQNAPGTEVYTIMDSHGLPYNWTALEAQWRYIYEKQLKVSPHDLPLVISVPTSHAEFDMHVMERYFELAFVQLGVPVLQIVIEPLAVALSMGKSSALVVDIGAKGCTVTPIVDGTVIKSGVMRSKFGGNFLDFQISKLPQIDTPATASTCETWYNANTWIQQFKSTMLQVSDKNLVELERYYQEQLQLQQQQQQQMNGFQPYMVNPLTQKRNFLYNGQKTITMELRDCYKIAEYLFQPNLASDTFSSADGLSELMSKSIRKAGGSVSTMGTQSGGTGASLVYHRSHAAASGNPKSSSSAQSPGSGTPAAASSSSTTAAAAASAGGLTSEQVYSLLLTNVIITGCTSLIGGTEQRIINELSIRFPQYKLTTYANQIQFDRKVQTWISMSAMASLPNWELGRWYVPSDWRTAPAPASGTI